MITPPAISAGVVHRRQSTIAVRGAGAGRGKRVVGGWRRAGAVGGSRSVIAYGVVGRSPSSNASGVQGTKTRLSGGAGGVAGFFGLRAANDPIASSFREISNQQSAISNQQSEHNASWNDGR
jgi:hypothetical protein